MKNLTIFDFSLLFIVRTHSYLATFFILPTDNVTSLEGKKKKKKNNKIKRYFR